jgi:hypothetical protein
MEIYLRCEGVTDYAVIYSLAKKVIINQELSVKWVKQNELNNWTIHRKPGIKITGYYKKVTALAGIALRNGNKNIAYHQDADRKYDDVYKSITREFNRVKNTGFNCLAIVPKEMIESWVLTDKNAYPHEPKKPQLPTKPEELWGKKESKKHPKKYLENVLKQFHQTPSADIFSWIIEKSDLEIIKEHCPISFGQFYADLQTFITKAGD